LKSLSIFREPRVIDALFCTRAALGAHCYHLLNEVFALLADPINVHVYCWIGVLVFVRDKKLLAIPPLEEVLPSQEIEEQRAQRENVSFGRIGGSF
jgi:hypothetical protein